MPKVIDLFSTLLNARVSIWKKGGTGVFDTHGFESQEYVLMVADVKARVRPGPGKELDTDAAFGIQTFTFYMQPLTVDDPARKLNIHDWLQINKTVDIMGNEQMLLDPPSADGPMYDILNIKDLDELGHHLEISTKFIEP